MQRASYRDPAVDTGHDARIVLANALMPPGYTRMIADLSVDQRSLGAAATPPERAASRVADLMSDAAEGIARSTLRVAGDIVRMVSNSGFQRLEPREGGWTVESIAERFREDGTTELSLDRSGDPF